MKLSNAKSKIDIALIAERYVKEDIHDNKRIKCIEKKNEGDSISGR